jgi:hypothetical protein
MEMVIDDEALKTAKDVTAVVCHREDLDRAIAQSMATVITNESTSGAAEVAGGRYQEDLDHAALEFNALEAMAGYKVIVISYDEESGDMLDVGGGRRLFTLWNKGSSFYVYYLCIARPTTEVVGRCQQPPQKFNKVKLC